MNMLDYIEEYGNFSLEDYPFNEIDAMIFAQISYLNFEGLPINIEDTMILFKDLYPYYDILKESFRRKEDNELLCIALSNSLRYSNLKVGYFFYEFSSDVDEQFSAITLSFEKGIYNISYRGTDASVVGWKEDFNLSFMQNVTSHNTAVKYFNYVHNNKKGKYRIIGHSKGGNIALYASIMIPDYQDLLQIYNFDGPSFVPGKVDVNKVYLVYQKYVPRCSIIGLLMEENSNFTIVDSNAKTIMQHDLYTWQIEDGKFVTKDQLDKTAIYIQKTINEWLVHAPYEKRELFIETIFDLLEKENVDTFKEMQLLNYSHIIKNYMDLDNELKDFMQDIALLLFQANFKQTKELLNTNKDELKDKILKKLPIINKK